MFPNPFLNFHYRAKIVSLSFPVIIHKVGLIWLTSKNVKFLYSNFKKEELRSWQNEAHGNSKRRKRIVMKSSGFFSFKFLMTIKRISMKKFLWGSIFCPLVRCLFHNPVFLEIMCLESSEKSIPIFLLGF